MSPPTDGMVTGGELPIDAIVIVGGDPSAEATTNDSLSSIEGTATVGKVTKISRASF